MPLSTRPLFAGIAFLLFATSLAGGEPKLLGILCDEPGAEAVGGVSYSADGKFMLTAQPNHARVWDVASNTVKATLTEATAGRSFTFAKALISPDAKSVANISSGYLSLWDVATGKRLKIPEDPNHVICSIAFRSDGSSLAAGDATGVIRIFDRSGNQTALLAGHEKAKSVTDVSFGPDGARLASASNDGTIRIWDVSTGKCSATWRLPEGWRPGGLAYSPDGKRVAAGGKGNILRIWELATGKVTELQQGGDGVMGVAFSPDGRTVAAGEVAVKPMGLKRDELPGPETTAIHLWDVDTGKTVASLRRDRARWPVNLAFSPDGRTLAAAVFTIPVGGAVERWDISRK